MHLRHPHERRRNLRPFGDTRPLGPLAVVSREPEMFVLRLDVEPDTRVVAVSGGDLKLADGIFEEGGVVLEERVGVVSSPADCVHVLGV